MARLPELKESDLTPAQRRVHDMIVSGPRGNVPGPLAVWLRRPDLAERAQALGQYCRYDSSLSPRLSELAILLTARHWASDYEWWAHEKHARAAGLSDAIIEAVRNKRQPAFDHDDEAVVHEVVTTLYREKALSDRLYERGMTVLGESGLVDLIGVMGYYALISMTINAFDVRPPDGAACFD
ncbi:MAG: carboxymuconolactone decarboxylase family protein [Candidatus Eiseniibacteriota bacterium]